MNCTTDHYKYLIQNAQIFDQSSQSKEGVGNLILLQLRVSSFEFNNYVLVHFNIYGDISLFGYRENLTKETACKVYSSVSFLRCFQSRGNNKSFFKPFFFFFHFDSEFCFLSLSSVFSATKQLGKSFINFLFQII